MSSSPWQPGESNQAKTWQTPADCIQAVIADSKHTRKWWAARMGYGRETFGRYVRGDQPVGPQFAVRFEDLTAGYIKAEYLVRLQALTDLRGYRMEMDDARHQA